MIALREQLFEELCTLVADLGKDGGLISPSVYDTAQVLRLYPPAEGVEPGLDWLISQQKADGGWGDPAVPTARDVPTLAAILTIFTYRRDRTSRQIVNAGLDFLEQQSSQWCDALIDTLPVAAEMILPYLIKEASEAGLHIDRKPYVRLFHLREKKLLQIRKKTLKAGTAPTYSWEALGLKADNALLDGSGGVGHSPAATASWLLSAQNSNHLGQYTPIATRYLQDAAAATGINIPGVVPNVYPIIGFEISYGIYALKISGLFDHPLLDEAVNSKCHELEQILKTGGGVSFGNFFVPDVDETALTIIALQSRGYLVDPDCIWQFRTGEHFYTFQHELNPSVLCNAHALNGLNYCGEKSPTTEQFLLERQLADGGWNPDKWHSSWRFTTLEVLLPLLDLEHRLFAPNVASALVNDQNADGGWGMADVSSTLETVYSVLSLGHLQARGLLDETGQTSLYRGYQRLLDGQSGLGSSELYWLGKELYSPYRVDRVYVLSTILGLMHQMGIGAEQYAHA